MGFEILTVGVEVIGQGDYQEMAQGVYIEQNTRTVAMLNREGTGVILVKPL